MLGSWNLVLGRVGDCKRLASWELTALPRAHSIHWSSLMFPLLRNAFFLNVCVFYYVLFLRSCLVVQGVLEFMVLLH